MLLWVVLMVVSSYIYGADGYQGVISIDSRDDVTVPIRPRDLLTQQQMILLHGLYAMQYCENMHPNHAVMDPVIEIQFHQFMCKKARNLTRRWLQKRISRFI